MLPIARTVLLLFKHTMIITILTADTKPRPNAHTCGFPMDIPQQCLELHTGRIGNITVITRRANPFNEPARPACFVVTKQEEHRLNLCNHVMQAAGLADRRAETASERHNRQRLQLTRALQKEEGDRGSFKFFSDATFCSCSGQRPIKHLQTPLRWCS